MASILKARAEPEFREATSVKSKRNPAAKAKR
jgi:hypothetical protein